MDFFEDHPRLTVLGNKDPDQRYQFFFPSVKHGQKTIHHTLCAAILNESLLFEIQASEFDTCCWSIRT